MLFTKENHYYNYINKNYIYSAPIDLNYDEKNIFNYPHYNNIKFYVDKKFVHKHLIPF